MWKTNKQNEITKFMCLAQSTWPENKLKRGLSGMCIK